MNYKISVIIPVYNAARFLRKAMDSLLEQSIGFQNLQVIAVDDCSTDESWDILSQYKKAYSNVEVYRTQTNTGAAGMPRNIGLEHAKAPYVMFLDPDDFYTKNACEVLYNKICETGTEIVGGRFYTVDEEGKNKTPWERDFPSEETRYEFPRDLMTVINWIQPIWQRIFDLRFIRDHQISFPDGFGQDTIFLNKCFVKGCSLVQIGDYILNYRQNPHSVTHKRDKTYFDGYLPCTYEFEKLFAEYPEVLRIRKQREAGMLFNALVLSVGLDKDEIEDIFHDCRELFVGYYEGNEDYVILSSMLERNLIKESAAYAFKCCDLNGRIQNERELIVQAYENRMSLQLLRAFKEKRYFDMIKIVVRRLSKAS